MGDSNFPKVRGSVKPADKPFVLFYKGDINLLNIQNLNIAVIGVLNPDDNIKTSERIVVKELVKQNAIIVSGLALGCDTIAHQTAIENSGKTVAILPSTLNNIIPKENMELAKIEELDQIAHIFKDMRYEMEGFVFEIAECRQKALKLLADTERLCKERENNGRYRGDNRSHFLRSARCQQRYSVY